jgi:hypothetical protein
MGSRWHPLYPACHFHPLRLYSSSYFQPLSPLWLSFPGSPLNCGPPRQPLTGFPASPLGSSNLLSEQPCLKLLVVLQDLTPVSLWPPLSLIQQLQHVIMLLAFVGISPAWRALTSPYLVSFYLSFKAQLKCNFLNESPLIMNSHRPTMGRFPWYPLLCHLVVNNGKTASVYIIVQW